MTISVPPAPPQFPEFFCDWIEGTSKTEALLKPPPDFSETASSVSSSEQSLMYETTNFFSDWKSYLEEHQAPSTTLENFHRLKSREASVVITGQQPALLGGPLYTFYKAATTCAAARILTDRGSPAVPVFWNHSDDHDLSEIDRTYVFDRDNNLTPISYGLDHGASQEIRSLRMTEATSNILNELPEKFRSTEFTPELIEMIQQTSSERPASWFTRLLFSLFREEGLLVFEPFLGRPYWASLLTRHLNNWKRDAHHIQKQGDQLENQDYQRALQKPERPDLFHIKNKQRNPLDIDDSRNEKDWIKAVEQKPTEFSPGVTLRPIVQDAFFPVSHVVGGPSEVHYFSQISPLYKNYDISRPNIVPRLSMSLVETKVQNVIDKFSLRIDPETDSNHSDFNRSFFDWPSQKEEILQEQLPDNIHATFEPARNQMEEVLKTLRNRTVSTDNNLDQPWEKTRNNILEYLDRYKKSVQSTYRRKENVSQRQLDKLLTNLFPKDSLQERVISPFHYFSLYSPDLADPLKEEATLHLESSSYYHRIFQL